MYTLFQRRRTKEMGMRFLMGAAVAASLGRVANWVHLVMAGPRGIMVAHPAVPGRKILGIAREGGRDA
jgi:hypothetical protein